MDEGVLGKEYVDGEVLCRQREPGKHMYVIQAGRAVVSREEGGAEVVVGELGPGDVFGEMAILDREPRSATVRASGTARVLALDKRAFLRGVHEDPSLAYRILEQMSRRIRNLDEDLALLRNVVGRTFMVRFLFIVSRQRPELYEVLARDFSQDKEVQVILDRRSGERRRRVERYEPERRRAGRRREVEGWTVQLSKPYRGDRPRLVTGA